MLDIIRRNSQSWVIKVIFGLIILSFVFWGASSMSTDSGDVIAKVNGENIYRADLIQEFNMEMRKLQQSSPDFPLLGEDEQEAAASGILRRMVNKTLLRQEASRLGIVISDVEFSAAITAIPTFQDATGKFNENVYRDFIERQGMTVGVFEKMYSDDLLMDKLREYVGSSVTVTAEDARRALNFELERRVVEYISFNHADYFDRINPSEAEIITYYSENKENWRIPSRADIEYIDFSSSALAAITPTNEEAVRAYYDENPGQFMIPESFHTRHILISLPLNLNTTEAAVNEARKKAESVIAEIKGGKSFSDTAKAYSDDPMTKENAGDLGWFTKGEFEPAYEAAVVAMKPGELSEPVRSYYGFHVIELIEAKPAGSSAFEEVKDGIRAQLEENAALLNLADAMAGVEDGIISGDTLETISAAYKLDIKDSGLMSPSSIQALLELPENIFDGIEGMRNGYMFPTPAEYGKGFIVLRLKEYVPSYIPEMETLRAELVGAIKAAGALEMAGADAKALLGEINSAAGAVPAAALNKIEKLNVTRFTGMMLFEPDEKLTGDIYMTRPGAWLPEAYNVKDNANPAGELTQATEPSAARAILVRVAESLPVEEKDWQQLSSVYIAQISNLRKNNLFDILLSELHGQSTVEVTAKYLLRAG